MKVEVVEVMRENFNSPSIEMPLETVEKYQKKASEFAKCLEGNIEEGLAVYQFPKEHWKKIRTSNGLERMNMEIKRQA